MSARRRHVLAAALLAAALTSPQPAAAEGFLDRVWQWLGLGGDRQGPTIPPPAIATPAPDLFPELPAIGFAAEDLDRTVLEKAGTVTLRLRRSAGAGEAVSVRYRVVAGSAALGQDAAAASGEVSFGDAREKTIDIGILDDGEHETQEDFTVVLSSPRNARLDESAATARISIRDDDPAAPPPAPAQLAAEPARIDFGTIELGQSRPHEFLVVNTGGSAASLERFRVVAGDGGGGAFGLIGPGCAGAQIAPGGNCAVAVYFAPKQAGAASGELIAEWREAGSANTGLISVGLSGLGAAPPPPPDPMAAKIAAAKAARRGHDVAGMHTVLKRPAPEPAPPRYDMADEDYRKINLDPSYFTYPVDRTRIITADRYIPCVLEVTINSQLPGPVQCQIESNVYGANGRAVLIPAGTKALGDYEPLQKAGDTRLNIVWQRFIRPDGSSIALAEGLQGLDAAGRTGLPGEVDNRIFERYSGVFFLTALSAATAYATASGTSDGTGDEALLDAQDELSEGLGRVTLQMLEQNLDLRPVITVAAGSRLIIKPLLDMWLPRPEIIDVVPGQAAPSDGGAAEGGAKGRG